MNEIVNNMVKTMQLSIIIISTITIQVFIGYEFTYKLEKIYKYCAAYNLELHYHMPEVTLSYVTSGDGALQLYWCQYYTIF